MAFEERRKDRRQEIQLQLEFAPAVSYGTPVTRTGVTQNVSPGGAYFHTNMGSALRRRTQLTLRIGIPRSSEDPGTPLALTGRARVKRIEELYHGHGQEPPVWGIAVEFDDRPSIRTGYDFWLAEENEPPAGAER